MHVIYVSRPAKVHLFKNDMVDHKRISQEDKYTNELTRNFSSFSFEHYNSFPAGLVI